MASEVLITKSKVNPPPKTSCPKTWQVALILCFVSIFFLLGVMLGCYVGLSYLPSSAKMQEMSTGGRRDELNSGSQYEEISHVEILNIHDKIIAKLQNSSAATTITCDPDDLGQVMEDKLSEMERILSSFNLHFVKRQKYQLPLIHKNYKLNISKFNFKDNSTRIQLLSNNNFAEKYEYEHDVDVVVSNEVKDKLILFDLDQQDSLQKMLNLVKSKPFGFLFYSSLNECCFKYNREIYPFLNNLAQTHNVFMEILSCDTEKKLKKLIQSNGKMKSDREIHNIRLFSQTKNENRDFTNIIVSFYGSKDPDYIVLVGASRCNTKGTERWLKLLKMISKSLSKAQNDQVWVPLRSIKFVSWSQLGIRQFIKIYKEAWKQKVLVYLDLDEDDRPNMYVSSSMRDFAAEVAQQLSPNYPKSSPMEIYSNNSKESNLGNCETLQKYMGVPCVKVPKYLFLKDKSKSVEKNQVNDNVIDEMVLKFHATIMLSMVDGKLLQISIADSVEELKKELNDNFKMFRFSFDKNKVETHINSEIKSIREATSHLLRISKSFQKSLEVISNDMHESYEVRKTNDLILRLESELRTTIHHVKKISSVIESQLYNNNIDLVRNAFEVDSTLFDYAKCDLNDIVKYDLLRGVRKIKRKIQGLARLLNVMEWVEF